MDSVGGVRQRVRHLPLSLQFPPLETKKTMRWTFSSTTSEATLDLWLRGKFWQRLCASELGSRKRAASLRGGRNIYKSQISKAGLNSPTKLILLMRKTGEAKFSTVMSRLHCGSSELRILHPTKYLDWGQTPPPPRSALGMGSDVEHFNHSLFIK